MPSTMSSSLARDLPSSTVMTPSLPTLPMASAMISPMDSSALAEMAPTWAISRLSEQGLEMAFSSATAASTALSMPRLRSIGFMPAATALRPSRTMAWASTVAVVVPSPATSLGLGGDLLDHLGAHVLEPVLELDLLGHGDAVLGDGGGAVGLLQHHVAALGAQGHLDGVGQDIDAVQDAGTGVIAELNFLSSHRVLPSQSNGMGVGSVAGGVLLDDTHDVFFAHHQDLLAGDLDLGPGILAEQDAVADLDVEGAAVAVVEDLARRRRRGPRPGSASRRRSRGSRCRRGRCAPPRSGEPQRGRARDGCSC